jgi:hypothetical protein
MPELLQPSRLQLQAPALELLEPLSQYSQIVCFRICACIRDTPRVHHFQLTSHHAFQVCVCSALLLV